MGQRDRDKEKGKTGLSRRDFLKVSAAATAAGTGLDFALRPSIANAADIAATYHTTCPYCSASCGQLVAVDSTNMTTASVLDIYGDHDSPINMGGLCAKGAGALQLVTNPRRLGVPWNTTGMAGTNTPADGTAWKRVGNEAWTELKLNDAMTEIANGDRGGADTHDGLVKLRNGVGANLDKYKPSAANYYNSKQVMFFGCSHANNEVNYAYRKMIAAFGTSNTEHQARI